MSSCCTNTGHVSPCWAENWTSGLIHIGKKVCMTRLSVTSNKKLLVMVTNIYLVLRSVLSNVWHLAFKRRCLVSCFCIFSIRDTLVESEKSLDFSLRESWLFTWRSSCIKLSSPDIDIEETAYVQTRVQVHRNAQLDKFESTWWLLDANTGLKECRLKIKPTPLFPLWIIAQVFSH